jgi:hypothetical protein
MEEVRTPSPIKGDRKKEKATAYEEENRGDENVIKTYLQESDEDEERILLQGNPTYELSFHNLVYINLFQTSTTALGKMTASQLLHETLRQIEERLFILKHEEGNKFDRTKVKSDQVTRIRE